MRDLGVNGWKREAQISSSIIAGAAFAGEGIGLASQPDPAPRPTKKSRIFTLGASKQRESFKNLKPFKRQKRWL
jgi:hypothetical protein